MVKETPTMTTAQIAHPVHANSRARSLWIAGRIGGTVLNAAALYCIGDLLTRPSVDALPLGWIAAVAVVYLACRWLARRALWLSWAEVPGAWQPFESEDAMRRALPTMSPDLAMAAVNAAITAVAGVLLAAQPGEVPAAFVGLTGGALLVFGVAEAGRLVTHAHTPQSQRVVGVLVAVVPPVLWVVFGTPAWVPVGIALGLVFGVVRAMWDRR